MPTGSGPGYFEDQQEPNKKAFVPAGNTHDVELHKRHIFVNGASPKTTVNMPNVSAAEGFEFIVHAINVPGTTDAGAEVDFSDGLDGTNVANITTEEEKIAFKSDGRAWNVGRSN